MVKLLFFLSLLFIFVTCRLQDQNSGEDSAGHPPITDGTPSFVDNDEPNEGEFAGDAEFWDGDAHPPTINSVQKLFGSTEPAYTLDFLSGTFVNRFSSTTSPLNMDWLNFLPSFSLSVFISTYTLLGEGPILFALNGEGMTALAVFCQKFS